MILLQLGIHLVSGLSHPYINPLFTARREGVVKHFSQVGGFNRQGLFSFLRRSPKLGRRLAAGFGRSFRRPRSVRVHIHRRGRWSGRPGAAPRTNSGAKRLWPGRLRRRRVFSSKEWGWGNQKLLPCLPLRQTGHVDLHWGEFLGKGRWASGFRSPASALASTIPVP